MNRSASASRSSVLMPGRRTSRIRARVSATIRPARLMVSISRGDLSVIMLPSKHLSNPLGDLLHGADRRNALQQLPLFIPIQHRRRLLPIGAQPGGHRGGIVIRPLLDASALGQTAQDLLVGDIEEEHRVHPPSALLEQALHALSLRYGADDAVKD